MFPNLMGTTVSEREPEMNIDEYSMNSQAP
jgi:hypothetical protein